LFDAGGGGINVSKGDIVEENHLQVITSGGSTGDMLKKLLQEESLFEEIEARVDTGKLQLMTIHEFSVSFVFRHHRYSR
jgi:fructose-1-phosphate kinase PfkB-like protein